MYPTELLNSSWYFKPEFSLSHIQTECLEDYTEVNLPHTVKRLPFNCFSHNETAMVSTYVKYLDIKEEDRGRRVILRFDGVMAYFELYCNGVSVTEHRGGYSRAYVDLTDFVIWGQRNSIVLRVDCTERNDIPPFGYIVDFLTYGGIYRDVFLYITEPCYISNVLVRYHLNPDGSLLLYPEVHTTNHTSSQNAVLEFSLMDSEGKPVSQFKRPASLQSYDQSHDQCHSTDPEEIIGIKPWDLESPNLYTLITKLITDETAVDTHSSRTGFRTVECKPDGFYLNGNHVKLRGVNRHQSYPYQGYAMGKNVQRKDADIIKKELGCNTVRTSHYMQSEHFLNRCDELGLLVFEEIPGWHYIGGDTYQEVVLNDVNMMITTDYNHPGIFIWGVRLNESEDSPLLYSKTNTLAKQLDPDRATTGVRYFKGSELKEDVYCINDFCHKGPKQEDVLQNQRQVTGLSCDVPYLVSEFCGHVYPCKPWDNENVREEHARIHARVQSRSACTPNIMGALAWCAFDYQTHGDYGSGDKICYHGVMDMFRMPKYASYLYKSQKSPQEEIVLETASVFSRGEKGDNKVAPVIIMTNCDYIEVELYGSSIGRFYPSNNYVGLPHPPVEIKTHDSFWIEVWQGAVIHGFLGEREVITRTFVRDACLTSMEIKADERVLSCSYPDDTRITCRFLDQQGNLLPYYPGILSVTCHGNIELLGPGVFPSMGGMAAFWVRSKVGGGETESVASVSIQALNSDLPVENIGIALKKIDFF